MVSYGHYLVLFVHILRPWAEGGLPANSVHRLHYLCETFVVGQVVVVHVPLRRTCLTIHLDNENVLH